MIQSDLIQIFRLSPAPTLLLYPDSPEYTIVMVNQAYLMAAQTIESDLIGKGLFEAFRQNPALKEIDNTESLRASLEFVIKHKVSNEMALQQFEVLEKGSEKFKERYQQYENIPILNDEGEVRYIMHCLKDIIPREQNPFNIAGDAADKGDSELGRLRSQQHFQSLVQDGADLIAILDMEGNYMYVSPTSIRVLDMPPEEFIGKNAFSFIHPEDADRVQAGFSSLNTEKRINLAPFRFRDKSGNYRWIETVVTNLLEDPAVNGIVAQ